jgi:3-hydroxymyristoyl/3-hydroxydecanoyl-(acyl carrier protein) dehydratase
MYADGKPIVEITGMSVRLAGLTRESVAGRWRRRAGGSFSRDPEGSAPSPALPSGSRLNTAPQPPALFGKDRLLAFAVGKPSEAFGEPYRPFDEGRFIARLPGPPFDFLDRITRLEAQPWKMVAGGVIEAQYDIPPGAWYFAAERQPLLPFAVVLEVALQACGWLAAYMGSALTSPDDLCFRNLEGSAELLEPVGPDAGTLTTRVRVTRVASSGGMIIQSFDFETRSRGRPVYRGTTTFGFFTRPALAQQVGLREARPYEPSPAERARGRGFAYPRTAPFPDDRLRMIDRVELFVPDGGPHGLGFLRGHKDVDPGEWFFQAHFYQDPVWPGSLGLESFVQLLKVAAVERWPLGDGVRFEAMRGRAHRWAYRGQVVPTNRRVTVQAVVTACDDDARQLTADGLLLVDGLVIYQMTDFTLRAVSPQPSAVSNESLTAEC